MRVRSAPVVRWVASVWCRFRFLQLVYLRWLQDTEEAVGSTAERRAEETGCLSRQALELRAVGQDPHRGRAHRKAPRRLPARPSAGI